MRVIAVGYLRNVAVTFKRQRISVIGKGNAAFKRFAVLPVADKARLPCGCVKIAGGKRRIRVDRHPEREGDLCLPAGDRDLFRRENAVLTVRPFVKCLPEQYSEIS